LDGGVLVQGWAARFATWPSEGIAGIPGEYTLRLERAPGTIGGQILDARGWPLPDAEVWFQADGTGDSSQRERPRERFGFLHAVPVSRTDAQGRWSIGLIPPRHPGFGLWARHPDFAQTSVISSGTQESLAAIEREDLKQLWAGKLVSIMKAAFTLTGTVVDENRLPISGAKVQQHGQGEAFTTDVRHFSTGLLKAHGNSPSAPMASPGADKHAGRAGDAAGRRMLQTARFCGGSWTTMVSKCPRQRLNGAMGRISPRVGVARETGGDGRLEWPSPRARGT
jgi:protocatechuate 3,4-dioxygenase beta subunit